MSTGDIRTCSEEVHKDVMGSRDSSSAQVENSGRNARSSTGFIRLFSDRKGRGAQKYGASSVSYACILSKCVCQKEAWLDG